MMKIVIAGKAFEAAGSSGHHETGDSVLRLSQVSCGISRSLKQP